MNLSRYQNCWNLRQSNSASFSFGQVIDEATDFLYNGKKNILKETMMNFETLVIEKIEKIQD